MPPNPAGPLIFLVQEKCRVQIPVDADLVEAYHHVAGCLNNAWPIQTQRLKPVDGVVVDRRRRNVGRGDRRRGIHSAEQDVRLREKFDERAGLSDALRHVIHLVLEGRQCRIGRGL